MRGLMLLLGLFGVASHFCLIRAFAAAPANIVAPFGYTALLWAILFSLLIFGEIPSPPNLVWGGIDRWRGSCYFPSRTQNMIFWQICRVQNVLQQSKA